MFEMLLKLIDPTVHRSNDQTLDSLFWKILEPCYYLLDLLNNILLYYYK